MAENKKTIVVYSDWEEYFTDLSDEEAGKLIKHFFKYVNDKNPELDDRILEMAFKPIKNQLKRDLVKWEETKRKRSDAGRLGGKASGESRKQTEANEANASIVKQTEANEADNDICNSMLSDNVNVNDILLEKETKLNITERKKLFYESLIPFSETYDKTTLRDFYEYWTEHGEKDLKFRKEKEKTFGLERRLKTWSNNNFNNKQNGKSKIVDTDEFKQINQAIRETGVRR